MRVRAALALGLLVAAVMLGACGEADDEPAAQGTTTTAGAIELTVLFDDGSGRKTTGTLTCRGADRRAEGALDGGRASAAELCAQAGGIADLLTSQPDKRRACTQIYGGPETAKVTGTIDDDEVDRRFSRTNGCELADYKRAAGLLER